RWPIASGGAARGRTTGPAIGTGSPPPGLRPPAPRARQYFRADPNWRAVASVPGCRPWPPLHRPLRPQCERVTRALLARQDAATHFPARTGLRPAARDASLCPNESAPASGTPQGNAMKHLRCLLPWIACAALVAIASALGILVPSQDAWSQAARTLKIVVPYTPGSGPDILSRLIADEIGRVQGATAVVENRPGAGTVIG